jgi:hypothetical protein
MRKKKQEWNKSLFYDIHDYLEIYTRISNLKIQGISGHAYFKKYLITKNLLDLEDAVSYGSEEASIVQAQQLEEYDKMDTLKNLIFESSSISEYSLSTDNSVELVFQQVWEILLQLEGGQETLELLDIQRPALKYESTLPRRLSALIIYSRLVLEGTGYWNKVIYALVTIIIASIVIRRYS